MPDKIFEPQSQGQSNAEDELRIAIHDTNEVIVSRSTVFSGDKLTLTRAKLIYEKYSGFKSVSIQSAGISDILNVTGSIGPIFGTIQFTLATPEFPKQVGMFWRKDAIRIKRIIDGYMLAVRKKIDSSSIPLNKLIPALIELGTDDKAITR